MTCEQLISQLYQEIKSQENKGNVAEYIPELANVNPEKFGIYYSGLKQESFGFGDHTELFSIQSISKIFALTLAFKLKGKEIFKRVGVEPSGSKFNSIIQLELENGIPRNPFINAGAIVMCDILISELKNPFPDFLKFISDLLGKEISYSEKIFNSEKSTGFKNIALCNFMKSYGNIKNEPNEVLDFYFKMCSILMNCKDLSKALLYLANDGINPITNQQIVTESRSKRINAILQTCGFYDQSGEFAFRVGLPGKSGVSGGIVAILPEEYCMAVWSPKLNSFGNSYRGMKFLEEFTTQSKTSIF